jgi:hypothetical protein
LLDKTGYSAAVIFLFMFGMLRSVVFCQSDSVRQVEEFVAYEYALPEQRVLAGFAIVDFHPFSSTGRVPFEEKEGILKQDF